MNPTDFARQDDPLAAIGASLTAAAHRRSARLRRRRQGLFAAVATTATLAVAGGAFAVTGVSTGVPALDRAIGNYAADDPWEGHEGPGGPRVPVDRRPYGGLSPTIDIPLPDGQRVAAAAYETRDGMICSTLVDPDDTAAEPRGGFGCTNVRILQTWLRDQPAVIRGGGGSPVSPERWSIHSGVARGNVTGATVGVEGGPPVDAVVSAPWQPPSWNGTPLRVFFAVLPSPPRGALREQDDFNRWFPTVRSARLADGTTVDVAPPWDATAP